MKLVARDSVSSTLIHNSARRPSRQHGPSRTPRDVVEKFHAVGERALATPAMAQKLKQLAVDPLPLTDAFVVEEIAAKGRLIRAARIQ
jgi:tripartite-type tricarboxylate transporter receptor subunit TctC